MKAIPWMLRRCAHLTSTITRYCGWKRFIMQYSINGIRYAQGTAAVDEAVKVLDITDSTRVLDIGAGIGGPAR